MTFALGLGIVAVIGGVIFMVGPSFTKRQISDKIDLKDPIWIAGIVGIISWILMFLVGKQ